MEKIRTAYELAIILINLIDTIRKSDGSRKITIFKSEKMYDNITIKNDKGFFKVVHSFAGQTITYDKVVRIVSTVELNFIEFILVFGKSEHVSIQFQYLDYDLIHCDKLTSSGYWYSTEQYEIPYWDVSNTMMDFAYCDCCGEPYEIKGEDKYLCPECQSIKDFAEHREEDKY